MYPTVEEILHLKELKECKLLTGNSGFSNQVKAITVMDNPEITGWLNGGEILLTNGYMLKDYDEPEFLMFIEKLIEKNTAALFLKLKRYINELPQSVIDYAINIGFPLVVIPNAFSWLDITTPVNTFIIKKQYYLVEKSIEIRDQLLKLVLEGRNIKELCVKGTEILGKPLAVFNKEWKFIAGSKEVEWENFQPFIKQPYVKQMSKLNEKTLDYYEHYVLFCKLGKLVFIPITYDYFTWGYIGLTINDEQEQAISTEDTFIIEQFAMLFMVELFKEKELELLTRRYISDFLFELLDGILTNEKDIYERGSRMGKKVYSKYQLLVFKVPSHLSADQAIDQLLHTFGEKDGILNNIFICGREEHIILFLPFMVEKGLGILKESVAIIEGKLKNHNIIFGVSAVHDIISIHSAYKEALFSLSVSNMTNRKFILYEKLGFLRFFWEDEKRLNIPFVKNFYMENFKCIVEHDKENKTDLVKTLEVYLQNEMSIPKASDSLFIHENTLRARIKRIESITNRNLKKPYDLFALMLGLEIYHFIKE